MPSSPDPTAQYTKTTVGIYLALSSGAVDTLVHQVSIWPLLDPVTVRKQPVLLGSTSSVTVDMDITERERERERERESSKLNVC